MPLDDLHAHNVANSNELANAGVKCPICQEEVELKILLDETQFKRVICPACGFEGKKLP